MTQLIRDGPRAPTASRKGLPPTINVKPSTFTKSYRRLLEANDLPTDGLNDADVQVYEGRIDGRTVGFASLRTRGNEALLRSVVVEEQFRGNAYGQQLVEAVLERAHASGVRQVYLLTTTATDFFEGLGMRTTSREDLPDSIRETDQVQTLCPETATVMTKHL